MKRTAKVTLTFDAGSEPEAAIKAATALMEYLQNEYENGTGLHDLDGARVEWKGWTLDPRGCARR